jgi:indolepyruvate ferredoxin oxidoreductase alpha subunit
MNRCGLADAFGRSRVPLMVLNVTHPLVPEQITQFCAGKDAVLLIEEGQPDFLEQSISTILRKADIPTRLVGKDVLPMAGEYTAEVITEGLLKFIEAYAPSFDVAGAGRHLARIREGRTGAQQTLGELPQRPPNFCTGCPERPVFTAIKLVQRETGPTHIATDIGCHSFATFPPFSLGNSILGYGMSLASAPAVGAMMEKRPIAVMGDGGFWHNGLVSGVSSALFNRGDGVLVILQNGYTSATGAQFLPNSKGNRKDGDSTSDIETTLRAMGVKWLRKIDTYALPKMMKTLREAMTTSEKGLKVVIGDGECQLARQRRIRPQIAAQLKRGERVVRTRFGVDDKTCTGDHACIRLSACPSLTLQPNPDPLKSDPVAHVNNDCVGCGLCGEVAHAAVLCPSFYRAEIVLNPRWYDRALATLRNGVIAMLQPKSRTPLPVVAE